jgi:hypothetical protein
VAASSVVVTALVLAPLWALPIGGVILTSARWPRRRLLVTGGAVAGVGLVGVLYVGRVVHSRPAPGFGWVSAFEFGHRLAFAALLLAVADSAVERLRSCTTATAAYDDPAHHD